MADSGDPVDLLADAAKEAADRDDIGRALVYALSGLSLSINRFVTAVEREPHQKETP